jgi:TRAP-type C4-dicarboxylate transport system permease small subunit
VTEAERQGRHPGQRSVLERVEYLACGLLVGVMTLVVFVAVVFRYVLNSPIGWSDELARLLFTWLVFLGGAVGLSRGAHIGIDTLVQLLPAAPRRVVAGVADGLVLVILAVFVYYGALLSAMTVSVTTPSLDVPVAVVYAAAPVGAALMLLHHLARLARRYGRRRGPADAVQPERG